MPDDLHLWNWILPSDTWPYKLHRSRWKMTEADDLRRCPTALKVEEPYEVRRPLGHAPDFRPKPPHGLEAKPVSGQASFCLSCISWRSWSTTNPHFMCTQGCGGAPSRSSCGWYQRESGSDDE